MPERALRAPLRPFSDPVMRNGMLLAGSAAVTSLLGLAFWIVAARVTSPLEVGRSSVVITVLTLIANVAGLNLTGSFSYLLPRFRASRRRFVGLAYGLTTGIALLLAAAFLLVVQLGELRELDYLVADGLTVGIFLVAAPLLVLFSMQDGVLIGLGRMGVVLAENAVFAVVKLLLLVVLGLVGIRFSVALGWIGAAAVIVPLVSALLFARLLPKRDDRPDLVPFEPRTVRRFVGLQYAGFLVGQTYLNTLPLVVALLLGSTQNAFFYLPWTIATTADLVSHSLGASLTVEGALDPARLSENVRTVLVRLGALMGVGATVGWLIAPQFLAIYGAEYAEHSVLLLRLFIVGAVFRAVVVIAQGAARALGRTAVTVVTEGITCVIMLGTSVLLLPSLGIEVLGWAWIVGNVVVAAVAAPTLVRIVRERHEPDPSALPEPVLQPAA